MTFGTVQPMIAMTGLMIGGALIAFHLGPTFAMVQSLAATEGRALAASLLLFVTNLVGSSTGPLLVGWISDDLAARYGADSLRVSLLLVVLPAYLWGAAHYYMAARTIAHDLEKAADGGSSQDLPRAQMA